MGVFRFGAFKNSNFKIVLDFAFRASDFAPCYKKITIAEALYKESLLLLVLIGIFINPLDL